MRMRVRLSAAYIIYAAAPHEAGAACTLRNIGAIALGVAQRRWRAGVNRAAAMLRRERHRR